MRQGAEAFRAKMATRRCRSRQGGRKPRTTAAPGSAGPAPSQRRRRTAPREPRKRWPGRLRQAGACGRAPALAPSAEPIDRLRPQSRPNRSGSPRALGRQRWRDDADEIRARKPRLRLVQQWPAGLLRRPTRRARRLVNERGESPIERVAWVLISLSGSQNTSSVSTPRASMACTLSAGVTTPAASSHGPLDLVRTRREPVIASTQWMAWWRWSSLREPVPRVARSGGHCGSHPRDSATPGKSTPFFGSWSSEAQAMAGAAGSGQAVGLETHPSRLAG